MTKISESLQLNSWRVQGIGVLRILFGLVWAIDAWFKWQPEFANNFASYLQETLDGQPSAVQAWLNFWVNIVNVDPLLFARIIAISETALALALIFGVFTNLATLGGVLLSLAIWAIPEGFGGPYAPGSTDIGAAIIYALLLIVLWLASAGQIMGIDAWLTSKLGRLSILASGPLPVPAK